MRYEQDLRWRFCHKGPTSRSSAPNIWTNTSLLQSIRVEVNAMLLEGTTSYSSIMRALYLPVSVIGQSVRSISSRLGQPVPIYSRPLSVIKLQDSNRRQTSFLLCSPMAIRALSVSMRQQVRSIDIKLTQPAASSEIPSSVTHLHLLSPISDKFLQLTPIILRLEAET